MKSTFRPFGGVEKFRRRVFEWYGASVAMALGVMSLMGVQFYAAEAMGRVGPMGIWTYALVALGLARLGALYINGHWRPTYHVRTLCSCISSVVWFECGLAAMGVGGGPFRLEGSVVFVAMMISEAFVASITAHEARVADEAAKFAKA